VVARRFAAQGEGCWAAYSAGTGVVFLAAWAALLARPDNDVANLGLGVAVMLGWAWLSALAARLGAASGPPVAR
jgi:hypothetical protein